MVPVKSVRDGEVGKVPYLLVVGDREAEHGSVTVRTRGSKETLSSPLAEAARMIAEGCRPPRAGVRA